MYPAWTLVISYGASIEWKILRFMLFGSRLRDFAVPRYSARSFAVHSHSRLLRKSNVSGKASLLMVVSTWKIFGPWSRSTLPRRQMLWCSWEWSRWPIRLRVCCRWWAVWWFARHWYEAKPVVIDFQPPSIATWLTLA